MASPPLPRPPRQHPAPPAAFGSLLPPPGTSSLTAWATDDFDSAKWVTLHEEPTTHSAAAFWYVVDTFTTHAHWNRTIFSLCPQSHELVALAAPAAPPSGGPGPPPPAFRYNALRRLSRKTPSPIGGTHEDPRSFLVHECTAQWVDAQTRQHIAVFSLCIPSSVIAEDNPRALRYWPFQYPKVRCYRFVYTAPATDASPCADCPTLPATLRYDVVPLGDEARSPRLFDTLMQHAKPSAVKMLTLVRKRMAHYDPALGTSTYVKRVNHDNLLPEQAYRTRYDAMKLQYGHWVSHWPECTDPVKFVHEEMSIAAYLCALWEAERREEGRESLQTFIDCGCGNGFLVYLLISEGHRGIGVDSKKRGIWDIYPDEVSSALHCEVMDPLTYDCSSYDWILGNHSDELSPWIPIMASRSQRAFTDRPECTPSHDTIEGDNPPTRARRAYPRFFVLPCCFFDFDGRKVMFGRTRRTLGVRAPHGMGKYEQYYRWIADIMRAFGFTVEYENLRIPSTKYVSLMGRFVQYEERITDAVIKEMTSLLLLDARQSRL